MAASTTNHWKLGLFVLVALAALIAVAAWFGARRFKTEVLIAYTFFDEPITGLEVGSPIRFRGMTIGSVQEIRVAPGRQFLEVASAIDIAKLEQIGLREPGEVQREGANVPGNLRAQIERSFVTGVAFIQTDFFDPGRYPPPDYPFPVPENTVHSVPSTQKNLQGGLEALLDALPALLADTRGLLEQLHADLTASDVPAVAREARGALASVNAALRDVRWGELAGRVDATLRGVETTLGEARALLADTRDGRGQLAETLHAVQRTLATLDTELNGADLPGTSASLRHALGAVAGAGPGLAELLPALRRAAESLRRLTDRLERDPGALLRGRATPDDPRNGR